MLHDYFQQSVDVRRYRFAWSDFSATQREDLLIRREFYELGDDTGEFRHLDFYALYII